MSRFHWLGWRPFTARLASLPPGLAVALFLIPEGVSRAGWLASAWLVLNGAPWLALGVYVVTKLSAGVVALWVYRTCEPALLQVRWFARARGLLRCWQQAVVARLTLRARSR